MNTKYLSAAILASLLVLSACENKSAIEKAEDKVNDALDRRPAEAIRDAAEDVGAAGKDFGEAVKDAAKDVEQDAKAAASNAAEDAKEAAQ
jgi:hypothetical protein